MIMLEADNISFSLVNYFLVSHAIRSGEALRAFLQNKWINAEGRHH